MNEGPSAKPEKVRWVAIATAILMTVSAAFAFYAFWNLAQVYFADLLHGGIFYTPVTDVQAHTTLAHRIFGNIGLLRFSWTPGSVFLILEIGAAWAIARLLNFHGKFAKARQALTAFATALAMTAIFLACTWSAFAP